MAINRYIALLRGINVGGQKKILMADLKMLFESIGFTEVHSYIQSGNVVFSSSEATALPMKIASAIENKYGFKVPVLVKNKTEWTEILTKCPFSEEKRRKSYVVLLEEPPSVTDIETTAAMSTANEEFVITDTCVYIYYALGAGKAKMGTHFFEKKLKVIATTRNYRTMMKLNEMIHASNN